MGEERLVRGDDRNAARECGFDGGFGGPTLPAYQLDEDVDRRGLRELDRIVEPFGFAENEATVLALVARADGGEFQRATMFCATAAPTVPRPAMPTRSAVIAPRRERTAPQLWRGLRR
jgi:hypothetical protein